VWVEREHLGSGSVWTRSQL